jgi:hypothetical protein
MQRPLKSRQLNILPGPPRPIRTRPCRILRRLAPRLLHPARHNLREPNLDTGVLPPQLARLCRVHAEHDERENDDKPSAGDADADCDFFVDGQAARLDVMCGGPGFVVVGERDRERACDLQQGEGEECGEHGCVVVGSQRGAVTARFGGG